MASSITEKKHFAETGHCRICGHRKQWTDELQSRIAELEQRLAEYGEHTKYCAVMHHPQNTVCTCGWKEIKK